MKEKMSKLYLKTYKIVNNKCIAIITNYRNTQKVMTATCKEIGDCETIQKK